MTEEELQALEAARQARRARKAQPQPQPQQRADISQRPDIVQAQAEASKELAFADSPVLSGLKSAAASPFQAAKAFGTRALDKLSLQAGDEALAGLQNLAFDLENPGVAPVGVYPRGVPVPAPQMANLEDLRKERASLSARAENERLSELEGLETSQPLSYHLGGVAGDLTSLAAPVVAGRFAKTALPALGEGISKTSAFLAGAKKAAPVAAAYGGASTYFGGEKDPAEVAKSAALSAALGGFLGGASRAAAQPRLDARLLKESFPLRDDLAVGKSEAKLLTSTAKDLERGNKKFFKFMEDLRGMDPKEELASLREMAPPQPVSRPTIQSLEALRAEKPVIPAKTVPAPVEMAPLSRATSFDRGWKDYPEEKFAHWWTRNQASQLDDDFMRAIGKEDVDIGPFPTPKGAAQGKLDAAVQKIHEIASRPGADKLPPDQLASYAAKEAGVPPKYARQVLFDFWRNK